MAAGLGGYLRQISFLPDATGSHLVDELQIYFFSVLLLF
jgi:hypothetical protein